MQQWLQTCVIGWNLCPFAAPVVDAGGLRVVVSAARTAPTAVRDTLQAAMDLLAKPPQHPATTLVVVPNGLADFDVFLDVVHTVESLLEQAGANGVVQLAHFHPQYVFGDAPVDDPAHATNRAPFPTLHLLRHADIAAAAEQGDTARIAARNADWLRRQPAEVVAASMPWLADQAVVVAPAKRRP
jgi:hypothetical protein